MASALPDSLDCSECGGDITDPDDILECLHGGRLICDNCLGAERAEEACDHEWRHDYLVRCSRCARCGVTDYAGWGASHH